MLLFFGIRLNVARQMLSFLEKGFHFIKKMVARKDENVYLYAVGLVSS